MALELPLDHSVFQLSMLQAQAKGRRKW